MLSERQSDRPIENIGDPRLRQAVDGLEVALRYMLHLAATIDNPSQRHPNLASYTKSVKHPWRTSSIFPSLLSSNWPKALWRTLLVLVRYWVLAKD